VEIGLGMSVSVLRNSIAVLMVFLFPLSMVAADTGSAILRSNGGVWVNGNEVAGSTTVFPGDSLQTKPGFVANLDAEGSSVLIQPETIVKYENNFLVLEHGSLSVGTSTAMSVHVNCIRVEPLSNERTQYEVADVSGKVEAAARKNDVRITQTRGAKKASLENSSKSSSVIHEGEQASREESQACGAAAPESPTHGLNPKWLEIGGGAGAGVIVLCLLLCKSSPKSEVSPSQP
jgi:hypothetical protein